MDGSYLLSRKVFTYTKSFHLLKNFSKKDQKPVVTNQVSYSFLFSSWVAPHIFFNRRLKSVAKKYLLGARKVYLLLTWIYYLTFNLKRQDKSKRISFALLPAKRAQYTLTKAPMAHKTFSKEQFKFQRYLCRVTIRVHLLPTARPNSFIQILNSSNMLLNSHTFAGTNILALYKVKSWFRAADRSFFTYFAKR
jgi:hypothetical protein